MSTTLLLFYECHERWLWNFPSKRYWRYLHAFMRWLVNVTCVRLDGALYARTFIMQAPHLCYQGLMKAVLLSVLMRPKLKPFTITGLLTSRLVPKAGRKRTLSLLRDISTLTLLKHALHVPSFFKVVFCRKHLLFQSIKSLIYLFSSVPLNASFFTRLQFQFFADNPLLHLRENFTWIRDRYPKT